MPKRREQTEDEKAASYAVSLMIDVCCELADHYPELDEVDRSHIASRLTAAILQSRNTYSPGLL